MTITTNAVGFVLDEDQQMLIDKKMERIKYAEDLVVDLLLRIKFDKKMIFEVTINFRWGAVAHISSEDYDFTAGLNKMMDVLDNKIKREKEKIQQKG